MFRKHVENKEYFALYINSIGTKFASTIVLSLGAAYLFSIGFSLAAVLLYFALEFGLRGLTNPFSAKVAEKIGLKKSILLSYVLLTVYFVSLSFAKENHLVGFFSFIFHSISRGIYYPLKHFLQAQVVRNASRGKFLTLEIVINILIGIFATGFSSFILYRFTVFFPIAIIAGIILLVSYYIFSKNIKDPKIKTKSKYTDVLKNIVSKEFREDIFPYFTFSINVVTNNVIIGLFLYYFLGDFKTFGIVMALTILVESVITLIYGFFIDKDHNKATKRATILQSLAYVFLVILPKIPFGLFLLNSAYRITWNLFDSSFTSKFHTKIKRRNNLIYACSKEFILGISMFLILSVYSVIALYFESYFFSFVFITSIIGAVLTQMFFVE